MVNVATDTEQRILQATLLLDSGIPKRNRHTAIVFTGQWGECLKSLEAKLPAGFLAALVGGRGCGKTQMGCQLIKEIISSQLAPALYITATEFFMEVKQGYNDKRSELEIITEYRRPKLLVIDEFGKMGETTWHNTLMFELLNKRYGDMSSTLLIDNNPREKFMETIGPSLSSRILETGGIIECNWKSFRE